MEIRVKGKRCRLKLQGKPIPSAESSSFWKGKTAEELAKEQGTKPFDISKCGENWPEGADYDAFMEAIKSGRKYKEA